MAAAPTSFGPPSRLLLLEPAMGFGPARLVLAPVGVVGARLPAGVRAVEGIAMPAVMTGVRLGFAAASSRRGSVALPTRCRARGFLAAPVAGLRSALQYATEAAVAGSSSTASRHGVVAIGATRRDVFPDDDEDDDTEAADLSDGPADLSDAAAAKEAADISDGPADLSAAAAAKEAADLSDGPADLSDASAAKEAADISDGPADLSAAAAAKEAADLSADDTDEPAEFSDPRSNSYIVAAWIEKTLLQTTFEVAFDAGVLGSGRDLRCALHAIGEIDLNAPMIHPWSAELCLIRIRAVIGEEKLNELLLATTPSDDLQFCWSAAAAQSIIQPVVNLMVILHEQIIMKKDMIASVHNLPLFSSCQVILRQLLKVVFKCSTIIESTKFRRPQSSIRYRMLEAHALAIEHVCAISMDVYEEVCLEAPDEQWAQLLQQLTHRRITLFEQDVGMFDYMTSIGLGDTVMVIEVLEKVAMEVKNRASSSRTG